MSADYYPTILEKRLLDALEDCQRRDENLARLRAENTRLFKALEETEKAYDRLLQEQLDAQNLAETKVDPPTQADEIEELLEAAVAKPVGPDNFALDELIAEPEEGPDMIINDPMRPERIINRLDEELQVAEVKVALAQGDRAKMQRTLTQTQNACRRYKARIARQKTEGEVLRKLAEAAFPLYEKLVEAMGSDTAIEIGSRKYSYFNQSRETEQKCVDFHNAFNEAAEALTPETRYYT